MVLDQSFVPDDTSCRWGPDKPRLCPYRHVDRAYTDELEAMIEIRAQLTAPLTTIANRACVGPVRVASCGW